MKSLIKLTDLNRADVIEIFAIADDVKSGKYQHFLNGKTVVLFFPSASLRTRVTFEKGIHQLGGQALLFPTETLDKREDLKDVCGYLSNWADMIIARHKSIELLQKLAEYSEVPVINAMTDVNHPCEMLSDLYSLMEIRDNCLLDKYLFCGATGNIGLAWKEASELIGFELSQCCPKGYEIDGLQTYNSINEAVIGKDIICTDSLPKSVLADFADCQVTKAAMDKANKGAILNPCPPFYRGEEVSEDAISSDYFVGYNFKKSLLEVQQAVIIYCLQK